MKIHGRWSLAVLWLAAMLGSAGAADQKAIVTGNQVNVRGQAKLNSEVVTQLNEGEQVVVIEEIPVRNPQPGDPPAWARIQLPTNALVWVFAPYVEPGSGVVNVSRLNLRSGPGENYSVLGRVQRGAVLKEIRVEKNWMEVEAPQGAHAYIAANFLKPLPTETAAVAAAAQTETASATAAGVPSDTATTPPAAGTTPATEVATTPAPGDDTPPTTQPVEIESAPAAPVDSTASTATTTPATASATPTTDTTTATESAAPPITTLPGPAVTEPAADTRRIVSREGRVIISRSIQAPTDYALESLDTRRTINYLHSEDLGVSLKVYAGRKVIVTGEELMDKRWSRTPIVEVESIRLVP